MSELGLLSVALMPLAFKICSGELASSKAKRRQDKQNHVVNRKDITELRDAD